MRLSGTPGVTDEAGKWVRTTGLVGRLRNWAETGRPGGNAGASAPPAAVPPLASNPDSCAPPANGPN